MSATARSAAERGCIPTPERAHMHEFARLAEGTHVILRPIRPSDDALERAFICGLSQDSRYNRLLSARDLTPDELRRLTRIDYEREMALIAVTGGMRAQLLGVARYVRDLDARSAEFALVVADAWQRKGLGSLLLRALQRQARAAGITHLHGLTLATNLAMQNLARRLGFTQRAVRGDATVRRLEQMLAPGPAAAAAAAAQGPDSPAASVAGGTARASPPPAAAAERKSGIAL